MRADDFTNRIRDIGRRQAAEWGDSTDFRTPDQDAFNLACAGRWVELHPRWNCLASIFLSGTSGSSPEAAQAFAEATASPAILHFEGPSLIKPWNYRCVHPLRHLYRAYRNETPWPLQELEGAGFLAGVLRSLPIRVQVWISWTKHRLLRIGGRHR
jgi:lipopolysaccharide biosynthesis glycosyltransferase